MKRVGIDYGRPGLGYKCLGCGGVTQYPLLLSVCECGRELKADEIELRVFPTYRIGKALQTVPRTIGLLTSLKTKLREHGIECVVAASMRGNSSTYIAPLLVSGAPPIIVDFVLDERDWEFQVLQAMKKGADLKVKALLIVKNSLQEMVRDMVNSNRVKVLAFEEESSIPEEAAQAIRNLLAAPIEIESPLAN